MTDSSFDPIAYINTPRWQESRLGLDRTRALLNKLGNPENNLRFLHVAGTNGKGSVCAYSESILRAAGYKTGLFTSPYIECFEERIRVNGENISADDLLEATLKVRDAADSIEAETGEHPTEFELMCAVALTHFAKFGCDICVMEVGLGGRLDSTNVIIPDACVITRIGLDHTDILGNTLVKVASEKAGIIKPGVPVVSYPQDTDAMAVIEAACAAKGCELTVADFSRLDAQQLDMSKGIRKFSYKGEKYETSLLGVYQPENAALAIEAMMVLNEHGWAIPEPSIQEGVASAKWPGRFEVVGQDPLFIVDGAHNPQGAEALAHSLSELPIENGITFIMGVLADKNYNEMLEPLLLLPPKKQFITYTPNNPRALSAEYLSNAIRNHGAEAIPTTSPEEAIKLAKSLTPNNSLIVAFGTLYSIGEIKNIIN